MYKKHGRDRETSLELQVKALVAKALEEQGMSMEPRILVTPPGGCATPVATSITVFYQPLRNTKVQLVGSRMRSMGVVDVVEPWLLGTFRGLPTNVSSPSGVTNIRGSIDRPCSSSAFATRAFT